MKFLLNSNQIIKGEQTMKNNVTINCRFALKSDMDFIYQSLVDMAKEANVSERFHLTQNELEAVLFGERKLAEILIAGMNQTKVGLVTFSETNRNFTLFKKPGIYVHDLYVLPLYRNQKVATHLVNELKNIAKQRDYGRIDGVVLKSNLLGQQVFANMPGVLPVGYIQYMRVNLSEQVSQ